MATIKGYVQILGVYWYCADSAGASAAGEWCMLVVEYELTSGIWLGEVRYVEVKVRGSSHPETAQDSVLMRDLGLP